MRKSLTLLFVLALLVLSFIIMGEPATGATATENSWTTKTSAPFAGSCEATVVNGKIYVFTGGANYEYDPATDNWTTKAPMPSTSWDEAAVVINDKIYVLANSVPYEYDPETDTWKTGQPMPTARSQFRAEAVNGKIYVISGRTGGQYSTVKTNEAYDPETDSWETKAEIPYHVANGGSTVLDNKIYVIGGQNEFHDPMNPGFVQIYDPAVDAWSQGAPHPYPAWVEDEVAATTGLHAPKRIYVMGGIEGFAMARASNYVYDPDLDVWNSSASMPFRRSGFALVTVNDLLYAIGGYNGWITSYSDNQQYIPFGYGTIPLVSSPANQGNYTSSNVPLTFELRVQGASLSYSLDGGAKVPLLGNTSLSDLVNGDHTLTIYATAENGNTSTLQKINFKVDNTFTTILVIATIVTVAIVIIGLIVYFKKRKHKTLAIESACQKKFD
jgi:N-acetylneuraminic acid mutarotase